MKSSMDDGKCLLKIKGNSRADEKSRAVRKLEKQLETDVEVGLVTTEAKNRLPKKEKQFYLKEKKRLWHWSAEQNCQDPLFFFQMFLCFFFLYMGERYWIISFLTFIITMILKGKQIVSNQHYLMDLIQKERKKTLVLRDGIYRKMDVRKIVPGDILRIKNGEQMPVSGVSVENPDRKYWEGDIFNGESGKVIACGRVFLQTDFQEQEESMMRLSEESQIMSEDFLMKLGHEPKDDTMKPVADRLEENVLFLLCGLSFLFLIYGWLGGQTKYFQWMYLIASLASGGLAIVKEIIGIYGFSLNKMNY